MTDRKVLRVVAAHAHGADDCRLLIDMLGITLPKPKRGPGRPAVDHGHGNSLTYKKGCRCDTCRDAQRLYQAALREKWQRDPSSADRAGHGKASTYRNCGCRCADCTTANRTAVSEYRARRRQRAALAETGGAR
ncbi:MAG: hypothetical protein HOV73_18310 [Streptomyces sp.]|nr:hypothetical protein [Streptomyces sp.]NUS25606.1 hypothetical protein [Streptomyces sp.]NUS76588.1 hypothetical protein [Streptomyces sp.]